MKSKVWHSFRMEIVLYALTSMILSVATVAVVFWGIWILLENTKQKDEYPIDEYPIEEYPIEEELLNHYNPNENEMPMTAAKIPDGIHFKEQKSFVQGWLIVAILLVLVLFIVYFLLLTEKLSRYLDEIADGIQEISAGNFDVEFSVRHEDELSTIAEGLNKMTSDLKLMMENERKTEYAKNELITNVAHDLRTPLTSIIGYLGLVAGKDELDEETKKNYVCIAYQKSQRLERLIEDLFSYTKVSFGQITLRKTTIDMVKLTQQLLEEFYPSIQEASLEVEFSSNEKQILLEVDGDLMARAIANLISNAIKYGRDGKKLKVCLESTTAMTKFRVTNFGKMIPKTDLDHIFDKFYRVEASRSTDTGGSGLGLAITRNVVQMHNGTMHVKSDPMGTVFTVILYDRPKENPEGIRSEDNEETSE